MNGLEGCLCTAVVVIWNPERGRWPEQEKETKKINKKTDEISFENNNL